MSGIGVRLGAEYALWALLRYGEGLLVNLRAVYRILRANAGSCTSVR